MGFFPKFFLYENSDASPNTTSLNFEYMFVGPSLTIDIPPVLVTYIQSTFAPLTIVPVTFVQHHQLLLT